MKKLLLFLFLSGAGHTGMAQDQIIPPTPIIPLAKATAPQLSPALRPIGARLLRSVTGPIGLGGKPAWLLFLGTRPKSLAKKPFEVSDQALLVDLKIVERKKQGNKWLWRTLRTIPLGFCDEFSWEECQMLWLQPTQKIGPIVRVPRPGGDELIAFPSGWSQKTAVHQSFTRSSSSITAISFEFDGVDEKGFFMVSRKASERGEDGDDNSYTFLKWNGKEWE
jgi:hypothetical protein